MGQKEYVVIGEGTQTRTSLPVRPAVPAPATRRGRGAGRAADPVLVVCWLAVAVTAVAVTAAAGSGVGHASAYVVTWVASTTVPGVLVWRALARPSSLAEELGFGNVLGIALLLVAWVPAALLGDARLAWWGPVTIAAVFLGVPSLRRHWRPHRAPGDRLPGRWHLAMVAVAVLSLLRLFVIDLRALSLPGTADSRVHPDMWFQLALVDQLGQTLRVEQAQAAGVKMTYHWFANADIAATAAMSGAPPTTVLFQLWLTVMTISIGLAAAALTARMADQGGGLLRARSWFLGPVAALLVAAVPLVVLLGEPRLRNLGNGVVTVSPSSTLGLVLVVAIAGAVIDLVRGRGGRGTWVLALLLMAAATGVKPSVLPVVGGGLLLVVILRIVVGRTLCRRAALLVVAAAAMLVVGGLTVTGSATGSEIRLFETLKLDLAMQVARRESGQVAQNLVTIGLLLLYLLTELPRLLGVLGLVQRRTRTDPAIWFCSGAVVTGFLISWVLDHPGFGQQSFWRVVIVLGVVTTVAVAARIVPDDQRNRGTLAAVALVAGAGIVVGCWVLTWPAVDVTTSETGPFDRLGPYAVAGGVFLLALGVLRLLGRLGAGVTRPPVLTLLVAFSFAAGAPAAVGDLAGQTGRALSGEQPAYTARQAPRLVTEQEQRAALWLRERVADGDRIVTNVFCVPTPYVEGCHSTGFWVAGLSGAPVVQGGWAYAPGTKEAYERSSGVRSYKRLPSPWPERFRLSLDLIRDPDVSTVRALRDGHGARWVFADRRATPVSPRLEEYADLVFANQDVLIFRLR